MATKSTEVVKKDDSAPGGDSAQSILPPEVMAAIAGSEDRLDLELLALAFQYAKDKHAGQKRSSGEDYITHCVQVATILGEIHRDTVSIAASLLHLSLIHI
mgnify:FL=1